MTASENAGLSAQALVPDPHVRSTVPTLTLCKRAAEDITTPGGWNARIGQSAVQYAAVQSGHVRRMSHPRCGYAPDPPHTSTLPSPQPWHEINRSTASPEVSLDVDCAHTDTVLYMFTFPVYQDMPQHSNPAGPPYGTGGATQRATPDHRAGLPQGVLPPRHIHGRLPQKRRFRLTARM